MKKVEEISIEEIISAFEACCSEKEVINYFGRRPNGASWRFINRIKQKANITGQYYQNKQTRETYDKNPRYCEECGRKLSFEQRFNKFCSSSCAAKYNNVKRGPRSFETKKKISDSIRSKFPEREYEEYTNETPPKISKLERWLGGENFLRGASQVPVFIKEYLMSLHDNKCEKCHWGEVNEFTGNVPLEVHHIDGDCTNNRIENLQLLCPNCHSLTPNFGSLNKNSKRFHRKKKTLKDKDE